MDYQILFIALSLVVSVSGHGKLSSPSSRGGVGYEEGPVSGGANGDDFVCRNPTAGNPAITLTAGGKTTLTWNFGAAHAGDCALFLSYDHAKSRNEQKYFKIANFPDCNKDNGQNVEVNLPTWLPSGQAVMRWDWYALHVYPTVEFYAQCVDVTVVSESSKTPAEIQSYKIPGQYPTGGDQAAGKYWNPFTNPVWKMEGPECAPGITDNCCDTTGYARTGYNNAPCRTSGTATTGSPTPAVMAPTMTLATPSPTMTGVTPASECNIYIVKSGDTMTKIAATYTANGYTLTALQLCQFNKGGPVEITACDSIYPGDNLVIPDTSDTSTCQKNTNVSPTSPDSGVQVVTPSLVLLISLVALCVI